MNIYKQQEVRFIMSTVIHIFWLAANVLIIFWYLVLIFQYF